MRVRYTLLCEDAHFGEDGRLDVRGVYNVLYAPGFPAAHDVVLVMAVEWDADEEGQKEFRVDILDPARSPTGTVAVQTEVIPTGEVGLPPQTLLRADLHDTRFPTAGTYLFELTMGEEKIPLCPLHLIESPDAA